MINNTAPKFTLDQGESVGPQVYRNLRQRIISGDLEPGTRISEAEISQSLSTSRQPVREAFIMLRNEGLVEVRPQRGTFVTKISQNKVGDARFIREAIEADIVKLLAEKSTPELVASLRELLELQRKAIKENDADSFMEFDERFHRTMAELAGKKIAWKIIANMKAHFDRVRHLSSTQKPLAPLIEQHQSIVDAIERNSPEQAEAALRTHMREVLRDLPVLVAQHPELFVN